MPAHDLIPYVALLRGVNVGGNNLIPMSELDECFRALGYRDVGSYINTGNVIFRAPPTDARELAATIEETLGGRFPQRIRTLIRDLDQMHALVEEIDRTWPSPADEKRNVIFLAPEIDSDSVLDGLHPKPDMEVVRYLPGTLLWSAKKQYLTRSQMLKLNRLPIYQGMTVRSPGTTRRIYELMVRAASGGEPGRAYDPSSTA
jgi:uncharacterized protein (DUF1697 family)